MLGQSQASEALQDQSLLDYLACDTRPSVVLNNVQGTTVFCNAAFERLASDLTLKDDLPLPLWLSQLASACVPGGTVRAANHLWTTATIGKHWVVLSGLRSQEPTAILPDATMNFLTRRMVPVSAPAFVTDQAATMDTILASVNLDYTSRDEPTYSSGHVDFLRAFDWSSTPIGPMVSWSNDLKLVVNWLMRDPQPAALYWGDECILLYNEGFAPMFVRNGRHMLGLTCEQAWSSLDHWPEYSEHIGGIFARGYTHGEPCIFRDQQIFLESSWGTEERFFDYSFVPIIVKSGVTAGFYQSFKETTDSARARRQNDTVKAIKKSVDKSPESTSQFWDQVLHGLYINAFDVPFAIAYTHEDHDFGRTIKHLPDETADAELFAHPCASVGLETLNDGSLRPAIHDALMASSSFMACLRRACESRTQQRFDLFDPSLRDVIHSAARDSQFSDKFTSLCLLPICPNDGPPRGILLLGLNPRRRLDSGYQRFLDAIVQEVSAIYQSTEMVKHADEMTRIRQKRFDQLASMSTAGLFEIDLSGHLLYANKRWHEITGCPGPAEKLEGPAPWLPYLTDDYTQGAIDAWNDIMAGESISYELKWRGKSLARSGITGELVEMDGNWSLATSYMHVPEGHPEMASVMGCLVEINQQKQATEDALERKKQQENFVDMTSHEMRNPMSAVLQSADSIIVALKRLMLSLDQPGDESCMQRCVDTIENSLDAAQTIVFCTQHQKRIIDDVLNLSKLNSHLLTFDPYPFKPSLLLKRCAKIFKAEVAANDVILKVEVQDSYRELVHWILMDSSRIQQILVNLITNAIKFTAEQVRGKAITLRVGASKSEPAHFGNVSFAQGVPRTSPNGSVADNNPDTDDTIYICFSVEDTGCGMDEDGLKKLFTRFFQAPQRSHVKYGGSGLGLYIARRLTELQGGCIGVASEIDRGSTFAFYIRANRCKRPAGNSPGLSDDEVSSSEETEAVPTSQRGRQQKQQPGEDVQARIPTANDNKLRKLHVLVVEDNLINQKVLAKQLSLLGWSVSVANHGQEALDHLQRTKYWRSNEPRDGADLAPMDVMLLDVEMPVMDGMACVREIRKLEQTGSIAGHVPVIAITANARAEQMNDAKAAGMDGVVSKPFRIPELVATIRALLAKSGEGVSGGISSVPGRSD